MEFLDITTIGIVVLTFLVVAYVIIETRDTWNPPIRSKGTPKYLKTRNRPPVCLKGRPAVLQDEMTQNMVHDEIEEFHEFLRRTGGYVNTKNGKVPINKAEGRLLTWSYRPFREGEWWSFVSSGIRPPESPYYFGQPSLIPNPRGNTVESPLTLVTGEEDVLRCIRGSMTVRIFPKDQPTFPKFQITEHGDYVCDSTRHKLRGEEFIVEDGTVLFIPRGWAYRIRLDSSCIALVRIPVLGILSGAKRWISQFKGRFSKSHERLKETAYNEVDEDGSDGSSVTTQSETGGPD